VDHRLRDREEVERLLGLPSLGAVPESRLLDSRPTSRPTARGRSARVPALRGVVCEDVPHGVTEAYRSIRTSILLSRAGEAPKTVLFSSAIVGEGKTTTLLHTATMFARLGARVLVIDADLRRPVCHRILRAENRVGLTEVLTGQQASMQRVRVGDARFCFLGSGSTPPNPTELLGSPRMKEVLSRLGERFDHILIDAPPIVPISDAVVLSTLVDGVVLVIDQRSTPRQLVRQARTRLDYARAHVLGFVLNRADPADGCAEFRREAA
jgi:capsular exopolysaccharide synthesis family protein